MSAEVKHSYTIACSSIFRDAAAALAARRRVNVADLARSVMLVVPSAVIEAFEDPGEPPPGDREVVVLKSGPSAGRPWRRKPRLQIRMTHGYTVPFVRKSIAIALALDAGHMAVTVGEAVLLPAPAAPDPSPALIAELDEMRARLAETQAEAERLKGLIPLLTGDPLPEGVTTHAEALYVMGFPPGTRPEGQEIRARFRQLAAVLHPDSGLGDHDRMSQLNQAMALLRDR